MWGAGPWSRGGGSQPQASSSKTCRGCGHPIRGGQTYVTLKDATVFHSECFLCRGCARPIQGSYSADDRRPGDYYHPHCWQLKVSPTCCVCGEKMLPDSRGMIQYSTTPYWGQKFCTRHTRDGTRRCFACNRVESRGAPHVTLHEESRGRGRVGTQGHAESGSGRALCQSCSLSVVMGTEEGAIIYREVRAFFARHGLALPPDLPVMLVDWIALNEARGGAGAGGGGGPPTHTMGMTFTEQRTTVRHTTTVREPPAMGALFGFQGPPAPVQTRQEVVSRRNEVSAIMVLRGMPRLLFCSVLAHECTHAFVKLSHFPDMTLQIEEGLCQLLAYLWLKDEAGPGSGNAMAGMVAEEAEERDRERVYYMNKIFEDESVVYGEGFRMAFEAYRKYGLRNVVNHLKLTGTLPL